MRTVMCLIQTFIFWFLKRPNHNYKHKTIASQSLISRFMEDKLKKKNIFFLMKISGKQFNDDLRDDLNQAS